MKPIENSRLIRPKHVRNNSFFFLNFICGPQYRARLKITRRCPNGLGRRLDKGRLLPNAPVNVLGKVRQDVIAPNIFTED